MRFHPVTMLVRVDDLASIIKRSPITGTLASFDCMASAVVLLQFAQCSDRKEFLDNATDLHIFILDAAPAVHVITSYQIMWTLISLRHTANGGTFTSSSASLSSQSCLKYVSHRSIVL